MDSFRSYSGTTKSAGEVTSTSSNGGGGSSTTEDGGGTYSSTATGGNSTQTSGASSSSTTGSYTDSVSGKTNVGSSASGNSGQQTGQTGQTGTGASLPAHTHSIPNHTHSFSVGISHSHGMKHTHSVSIPSHSHAFTVNSHSHSFNIPSHSHTVKIPGHSHDIVPGIYRSGYPTEMTLFVNGVQKDVVSETNYELDITEWLANADGEINRGSWQTLSVKPNDLAHISVTITILGFIQSMEGGTF